MLVKIIPQEPKTAQTLIDFLRKHGFGVEATMKDGGYMCVLSDNPKAIDSREALDRLQLEPKVARAFQFTIDSPPPVTYGS